MKTKIQTVLFAALLAVVSSFIAVHAQNAPQAGTNQVQPTQSLYYLTPISATAAVNTATTLTIPAPAAGLFNYVCQLSFEVGNDNTGTAVTNVVSTSTNFNSFAVKFSAPATASIDSGVLLLFDSSPVTGCLKSTSSGTATTFVSPVGVTHSAWTWYAAYFQAP